MSLWIAPADVVPGLVGAGAMTGGAAKVGHHSCYSEDTEVLTRRGWIRFEEARTDDAYATRSASGALEWQRCTRIVNEAWGGDMYRFHARSLDLLVTPNHRMLVNSVPHALGQRAPRGTPRLVPAEELAAHYSGATRIPKTARWEGTRINQFEFVDLAPSRFKASTPVSWEGDDFIAFMASWLADGSLSSGHGVVLSRTPGRRGYEEYTGLLNRLGIRWRLDGHQITFSSKRVAGYLRQFGTATKKFIPAEILDAPREQLDLFWRWFWLGDGGLNRGVEVVCTSSPVMAGQFQEVLLKRGYWGTLSEREPPENAGIGDRRFKTTHTGYIIRQCSAKSLTFAVEQIRYRGMVGCVTVPNGTLYVRRNGRTAWCGNTEGASYAGARAAYAASGNGPHLTDTFENGRYQVRQHLPLNVAATALLHPPGTGQTNRDNVIQIEHVGFAASSPSWAPGYLAGIAALCRAIEAATGCPSAAPLPFTAPGTAPRASWDAWHAVGGHYGHEHVPSNDHVDPGAMDVAAILAPVPAPPPVAWLTLPADQEDDGIMRQVELDCGIFDGQGRGAVLFDGGGGPEPGITHYPVAIRWDDVRGVDLQGSFPPVDGYRGLSKVGRQNRDGFLCVQFDGGPPGGPVTVVVTVRS